MPRADEMGRRGDTLRTGHETLKMRYFHAKSTARARAPSLTTTAHFVGRRGVPRLSPHLESTLSTLPMSDQTLGRSRGGADKYIDRYCVTDPGTTVSVNTGVNIYATGAT